MGLKAVVGGPAGGGGAGGAAISAGASSQNSGTITFSNSNGVSFGLLNGVLTAQAAATATAGLNGILAGTQTASSGSVSFVNSNGVTFGMSNSSNITAAYSTLSHSNANGITFGIAGSTITASYNSTQFAGTGTTFAGTNASASITLNSAGLNLALSAAAAGGGGAGISAGTQSVSSGTVVLSNSNGITFGMSNSSIVTASYNSTQFAGTGTTFAGTNISGSITQNSAGINLALSGVAPGGITTQSLVIAGNTTGQSSASTYNLSNLNISATGVVSVGWSSNSLIISAPGTTTFANLSVSAGTTTGSVGSLVFSNSNGVSFGLNGSTITASAAGGGGAAISAGTQSTNGGTVVYSNSNGITFGMSNSSVVTASYNSTQFAGTGTTFAGTNLSASITLNSAGLNLALSSPAESGIGLSAAGSSQTAGNIVLSNSNGVTFGMNVSTVTASVAAQTNQSIGLYAVGNTTQNSSTTLDARTLSFDYLGAMTGGFSNGSIQISAPATSSLSGTGGISISVNASTISIGLASALPPLNTDFYAPYGNLQLAQAQVGQGSLIFDPQPLPAMQFDRIVFPIWNTNSTLSSGSHSLSFYVGLYSRNASTLSLVGSTSLSTAVTHSGTLGSYSLYSGLRNVSIGSTATLTSGNYWLAFASRTSSAGADGSYSNLVLNNAFFTNNLLSGTLSYGAIFGVSVNATDQIYPGQGYYTATTTGMPASVAFSQINGTASGVFNTPAMYFRSSTL